MNLFIPAFRLSKMKEGLYSCIFALIIVIYILSCGSDKGSYSSTDENVIAYIDSVPIFYSEVDNKIRQELFDELNRIYLIRKISLEEIIKSRILSSEARKMNVTADSLLVGLYRRTTNEVILSRYIELNRFNEGIPEYRKNLIYHDIETKKGQEILIKRFKKYILNQYIDSLKAIYDINVLLKPPSSPIIILDDLLVHYKGNLNSKVTFLEISDFDCDMCRENRHVIDNLYLRYKDKVRFGFTHYGSYVSSSAIASECAFRQGKFWSMYDSIFSTTHIPDSADLFKIAANLEMNMETFIADFLDEDISHEIENNLNKLEAAGIYGTPTLLINNKLIFNSSSITDIENILIDEIAKVN